MIAFALMAAVLLMQSPSFAIPSCDPQINVSKELLITDSSVVNSSEATGDGIFSFQSIFKKFAQTTTANDSQLALAQWLDQWKLAQLPDGLTSAVPRSTSPLQWVWPKDPQGNLSLKDAPFILSAIVFHPDVAVVDGHATLGELRFVFNLFDTKNGGPLQLTTIFEFPIYQAQHPTWLNSFHKLSQISWGAQYLSQLNTLFQAASPLHARLRTDDFFMAYVWDLREFQVDQRGRIQMQALPMTPGLNWAEQNNTRLLSDWVKDHAQEIENEVWTLNPVFGTANAFVPDEGFTWLTDQGVSEKTRHQFALHTCNGCHGGETITRFTHVTPRSQTGKSEISQFLSDDLKIREKIFKAKLCRDEDTFQMLIAPRKGLVH